MTSELKPGEFICELVSGGQKNYAYKSVDSVTGEEKTVCKVRGITLNYSASQLVNFESIRRMILRGVGGETDTVTVHTERKIERKRGNCGMAQIVTEPEDKTYRVSFFKRRRLHDNTSVPFGYIRGTRVGTGIIHPCATS